VTNPGVAVLGVKVSSERGPLDLKDPDGRQNMVDDDSYDDGLYQRALKAIAAMNAISETLSQIQELELKLESLHEEVVPIELPSLVDDEVELNMDEAPQGWDISFSTNPTKFYELESKSKEVGVTITPKEGEIPGVYTIIITAESKSHGYQGKIIVNLDVRP